MDIIFNTELARYEVFSSKSVVRAGSLQPVFTSGSYARCEAYVKNVEGRK